MPLFSRRSAPAGSCATWPGNIWQTNPRGGAAIDEERAGLAVEPVGAAADELVLHHAQVEDARCEGEAVGGEKFVHLLHVGGGEIEWELLRVYARKSIATSSGSAGFQKKTKPERMAKRPRLAASARVCR